MRLIDADKLEQKAFCTAPATVDNPYSGDSVVLLEDIENAPTIDPEDLRPRSMWKLNKDGSGTCKRCHHTQMVVWDYDTWQNYCGHCGAKMEVV